MKALIIMLSVIVLALAVQVVMSELRSRDQAQEIKAIRAIQSQSRQVFNYDSLATIIDKRVVDSLTARFDPFIATVKKIQSEIKVVHNDNKKLLDRLNSLPSDLPEPEYKRPE